MASSRVMRPAAVCLLIAAACTPRLAQVEKPVQIPADLPPPPIRIVRDAPDFVWRDHGAEKTYEVWHFPSDGVVITFVTVQEPGRPPRMASPQEWETVLAMRREAWERQPFAGKMAFLQAAYRRERSESVNVWNERIASKEEAVRVWEQRWEEVRRRLDAIGYAGEDAQERQMLEREERVLRERLRLERAILTLLRMRCAALFGLSGTSD